MTDVQEGDLVTVRLLVVPDDGLPPDETTQATVTLTGPSGQVRTPTARTDAARAAWTASLVLDEPGEWRARWRVTGTGEGVHFYPILVEPDPTAPAPPGTRVYASTADLARHLRAAPQPGAAGLLARASRKVDRLLLTAVYPVDDAGMPTEQRHRAALREATCAQVAWWDETGDETGSGAVAALAGSQIGGVKLMGGSDATDGGTEYAPLAVEELAAAGLLSRGPAVDLCGPWR